VRRGGGHVSELIAREDRTVGIREQDGQWRDARNGRREVGLFFHSFLRG